MSFSIAFLLILTIFCIGTAIKCVSENKRYVLLDDYKVKYKYKRNATTCGGDMCISYSDTSHFNTDRDCISGFNQSVGCWRLDKYDEVCACNTDMCNNVTMDVQLKQQPAKLVPFYKCHSYVLGSGREPTATDLNMTFYGTLCEVQIFRMPTPLIRRSYTWRLPVPVNPVNAMSFLVYAYVGGVYAETDENAELIVLYQCRGDYCSDNFSSSWLTKREDVMCHNTGLNNTNLTCRGEFCILYDDPWWIEVQQRQACLTMNQTNAEGKYGIGIYKTRSLTMYICKGNNCNKDRETAKTWIEDYGKGLVQAETPKYGKALNLENVAHSFSLSCTFLIILYLLVEQLHHVRN